MYVLLKALARVLYLSLVHSIPIQHDQGSALTGLKNFPV